MITNRCLWKTEGTESRNCGTYDEIFTHFASPAKQKSFFRQCADALVVVQELSLTWFIHARYRVVLREDQQLSSSATSEVLSDLVLQRRVDMSTVFMLAALLLAVVLNSRADTSLQQQTRREKVRQRITDALLLAVLLRVLAAVLRSLTASYSADTVQRLTISSMVLHVLTCDYSYANGIQATLTFADHHDESKEDSIKPHRNRRPPFSGGTVSLNTVLFAMVLAVSRLQSNVTAYSFVLLAVIIFAFYPATRHAIAHSYPPNKSPALWILTSLVVTANMLLLDSSLERAVLAVLISVVGFLLPLWQCRLQDSKILLRGTWDIPTAASMKLSAAKANTHAD